MFRAQDPGFEYDAPTGDHAEEHNELYSKERGKKAHELHLREGALLSV